MAEPVRIVVVSHSAALADGVLALARQMAPDVDLVAAGGTDDDGLGTSFERIAAALDALPTGGAVVLYDLGSALLTTETALEFLDPDAAAAVEIVDAPLVEGALAAATAAQGGTDRAGVAAAASAAGGGAGHRGNGDTDAPDAPDAETIAVLSNPLGLHARPAAALSRAITDGQATVTVGAPDGTAADLRNVLDVVRLALRGGAEVRVRGYGAGAEAAVAQVAQLIRSGFGESAHAASQAVGPPAGPPDAAPGPRPGAPGRAIGPLLHARAVFAPDDAPASDSHAEQSRLETALDHATARLRAGDDMAQLLAALLTDTALLDPARDAVAGGDNAAHAWWTAVQHAAQSLSEDGDELIAGRAADVRDAGAEVLRELGVSAARVPDDVSGGVLAVADLGPRELGDAATRGAAGIVLAGGSPTAHAVIVARGLGLPVVLRAGALLDDVPDGTTVAIDGAAGTVDVDPADAGERSHEIKAQLRARADELADAAAPVDVGGRRIVVAANVGSLADARAAVRCGADAVGLLRTELLVLDRAVLPGEDEQVDGLGAILDAVAPRPVVVRVLDAGGDKPVAALHLDPDRNGFLGVRGLRWLLADGDVLHTQLRAICRAGARRSPVSVMAPMVTVAGEMRAFRAAVDAAVDSLVADGTPHARPAAVGAMIEVPAAGLAAEEIAEHADFLSVGTNDLTSYTMAADRTNAGVAELLDPHATALWRLLEIIAERAGGLATLAVCGELAAVPEFAARLVDLGFDELSAAPAAIPDLKRHLRTL